MATYIIRKQYKHIPQGEQEVDGDPLPWNSDA